MSIPDSERWKEEGGGTRTENVSNRARCRGTPCRSIESGAVLEEQGTQLTVGHKLAVDLLCSRNLFLVGQSARIRPPGVCSCSHGEQSKCQDESCPGGEGGRGEKGRERVKCEGLCSQSKMDGKAEIGERELVLVVGVVGVSNSRDLRCRFVTSRWPGDC